MKKATTPKNRENYNKLRAKRKYPINVHFNGQVIGTMNRRQEVIITDLQQSANLLRAIQEREILIHDLDHQGNFLTTHVELRPDEKN